MSMASPRALLAGASLLASLASAPADAAAYYQGKSITFLVGNNVGGGYDAYARVIARHFGAHIAGQPLIVVKNMPEGNGLAMANNLAVIAPRDGYTIGLGPKQIPFEPLFGNPAAKYTIDGLTWIGTPSSYANDAYMMFVRADSPYHTLADLQKPGPPAYFAAGAAGQADIEIELIARAVFKLNVELIRGYPGSSEMSLALQRGEVQGLTTGMSALQTAYSSWLKEDRLRFLLLFGKEQRWARLPDVPTAMELARNPEDRALIELTEYPFRIARPVMAPPKLPPEAEAILKRSFMETMNDPAFLADAERLTLDISPLSGDEVTKILAEAQKIPPESIARYKQIVGSK
jgi:tripartite-type tricarboxylate transporter receptor subunit TctC